MSLEGLHDRTEVVSLSVESRSRRFEFWAARLEAPITVVALLVIPALLLEVYSSDVRLQRVGVALNWLTWFAFCAEFLFLLALAPNRRAYTRASWFNLALIALSIPFWMPASLQSTRTLRVLRAFRFLRVIAVSSLALGRVRSVFARRKFHYVTAAALFVLFAGATTVYLFEAGLNPSIKSPGDALWWAIVTATTVGYGDVSPVTLEGRVIAVVLMLVGIGVIGVFTATVASYMFEQPANSPDTVDARLERIERKLDELINKRMDKTL